LHSFVEEETREVWLGHVMMNAAHVVVEAHNRRLTLFSVNTPI
jgi:hypothetical protein